MTGQFVAGQFVADISSRTIRRRTICRGHIVADNSSHVNSLPDYCDELSMRRIVLRRIVLVPESDWRESDKNSVGSDRFFMKNVRFRWNPMRIRSKTTGSAGRIDSPGSLYKLYLYHFIAQNLFYHPYKNQKFLPKFHRFIIVFLKRTRFSKNNDYLFQDRRRGSIFRITFVKNRIETCGFYRWKEEIKAHRNITFKFFQGFYNHFFTYCI